MRKRVHARLLLLIAMETILIVLAVEVAAYLRMGVAAWDPALNPHGAYKSLLVASVVQICLYGADLYDLRLVSEGRELFTRLLQALGAAALLLAGVYFWFPTWMVGRGVFLISAPIVIGLVSGWRLLFDWVGPRERLLIVGTGAAALALARELFEHRQELGLAIVGFVDPDPARAGQTLVDHGVVGTIDDIPSMVREQRVDRVVVSLADARGKLPMDKLLEMRLTQGVPFSHLASLYEEYTGKVSIENLRPSWLIFSEGFKKTPALRAGKRAMDVTFSMLALVLLAPVMLLVALLVKATSAGPALYHQERVGQEGRPFTVHKFRSMRADAEDQTGAVWATANDTRVTPIGNWLRRTRFDELPQFWNVLAGEMSLVGPRPERPEFVSQLTDTIPYYGLRHGVRPGITGWAQVRYTYGASVEDAMEKLQYDLFYLKHISLTFDLLILFMTIKTVLFRRGGQ